MVRAPSDANSCWELENLTAGAPTACCNSSADISGQLCADAPAIAIGELSRVWRRTAHLSQQNDELLLGVNTELPEDRRQVVANCALADVERLCDCRDTVTDGQPADDIQLARRQPV